MKPHQSSSLLILRPEIASLSESLIYTDVFYENNSALKINANIE